MWGVNASTKAIPVRLQCYLYTATWSCVTTAEAVLISVSATMSRAWHISLNKLFDKTTRASHIKTDFNCFWHDSFGATPKWKCLESHAASWSSIGMLSMCIVHMRGDSKQMAFIPLHLRVRVRTGCDVRRRRRRVHPARFDSSIENAGSPAETDFHYDSSMDGEHSRSFGKNGDGDEVFCYPSQNATVQFRSGYFVTIEIVVECRFTRLFHRMQMHFQSRHACWVPLRMPSIVCRPLSWIYDVRLVVNFFPK